MTVATPRDIDDEAVAWAVRIDADGFGADEATALEAWLARDSRHGGALLRAEAAMALLDREDLRPVAPPPHREPRRWAWRGMAVGAGLSAIAAAAAVVLVLAPRAGDYRTDVGEQRRVMLDDGSVALVNTDSRIRVRFAEGERRIRLDEGEAWFQVAKNADRPFIVDVDDVHVRATGTAFSVRRRGEATEVVVTEGAVVAWRDGEDADRATISVGQGARIEPRASKVRVDVVDDRSALAWRGEAGAGWHDRRRGGGGVEPVQRPQDRHRRSGCAYPSNGGAVPDQQARGIHRRRQGDHGFGSVC